MKIARKLRPKLIRGTIFEAASRERLKDAECLHEAERFNGAIYLCGYALECRLKFCVCEARRVGHLEEAEAKRIGHGLAELLDAANLAKKLAGNRDLWVAFHGIVEKWTTGIRYSGAVSAIKESDRFIRDTRDLCLWLKTQSIPLRKR